ncbi:MAG: ATP-binding cassette domain-containing protein [Nitrospinae bacterium]|nr:ATP-binding cassette domain-containing protein [Nitrospinota bacterium]
MISVDNLTKKYGPVTAVDGISFFMEQGEICGFLGPNGAGKTTTMRILTGFMPPTDGRVTVAGFDVVNDVMEVKKRIGYLPESTPLYTEMRVEEYLYFVADVKGLSGQQKKSKVGEVMESTGISGRSRSLIRSLSKGYRQRVGLAQALLNDPEALILDEPTIGLDPQQIAEIRSLIKDLSGKRTVILSSHILPEVQMICSRVLIINNGKLIAADTPENLSRQFAGGGRIIVKIEAPMVSALEALGSLPGVDTAYMAQTTVADGVETGTFHLIPGQGKNPRKELMKMAVDRDWEVMELSSTESLSLEEVYLKLVTREPQTAAEPVENPAGEIEEL